MRLRTIWTTAALVVATTTGCERPETPAGSDAPAAVLANPGGTGERTAIVTLGTGAGPVVRKLRSQPANLLVVDGKPYLIDAGEGVTRQLTQAGFQPSQVDQVFLTHLHFDHTAGLASFMAFDWTNRRKTPVDIHGPPGTASMVEAGIAYFANSVETFRRQLPLGRMDKLFRAHDLDIVAPTVVHQDERVRVLAVENSHYATVSRRQMSYGPAKAYSYRFETPDRVVVFTGDTGPSAAVEQLAKGADVLVSEVIDIDETMALLKSHWKGPEFVIKPLADHMRLEHLTPQEVGKMATRAGVKRVVLTHIAPGLDERKDFSAYVAGVRETYAGPVVLANDLDKF